MVPSQDELLDLFRAFYKGGPSWRWCHTPRPPRSAVDQRLSDHRAPGHCGRSGQGHFGDDNLVKGASGQAVQSMNIMFGLEETSGLRGRA